MIFEISYLQKNHSKSSKLKNIGTDIFGNKLHKKKIQGINNTSLFIRIKY